MSTWSDEFRAYAVAKLQRHHRQIVRCAGLLRPLQLWSRANEHCNSVGNLILHLTGNVRQWIVGALGGRPFVRDRRAEFAQREPLPLEPILAELDDAVRGATAVISTLDPGRLSDRFVIQGYQVSGLVAVFHAVEHFSFHTGQIVHITKQLLDIDLSLYDEQGRTRDESGSFP